MGAKGVSDQRVFLVWVTVLFVATGLATHVYTSYHPNFLPELHDLYREYEEGSERSAFKHRPPFASPIRFMTVLSGPYRRSCEMLESAAHNGITMHVIGWGSEELKVTDFKKKEEKLKNKPRFLYNAIKDWPDDTIIMFIDGGDVLWQAGPEHVYTAFKQLTNEQKKVVFSAEKNCWIRSLPHERCADWPHEPNTKNRFLNSGCWLGELSQVKPMLQHADYQVDHIDPATCEKCGDQAIFGKAYIADGWNASIQLDYHTQICQNLHLSGDDFGAPGADGKLWNTITKQKPALFHFNGNPRNINPDAWHRKMWWNGRKLPRDSTVIVDNQPRFLEELCPKLAFDGPANTAARGAQHGARTSHRGHHAIPYVWSMLMWAGAGLLVIALGKKGRAAGKEQ
eukprot:TRINITY_DN22924_c0_g1_i1.p1 TRINITY_DN22924_c0_g1~~TRINITY_DN22924_c0_g1_i1.p1  ORF type:complete len:397 (+),score=141.12 TRINITY_DN22924_c0_g1_i1:69-1259(+)